MNNIQPGTAKTTNSKGYEAKRAAAVERSKRLRREADLHLTIDLADGVKIEDCALEGVGTLYKDQAPHPLASMTTTFNVKEKEGEERPARPIPGTLLFPEGSTWETKENPNSPYVLTKEDGQLVIKNAGRVVTEVSFCPRPQYHGKTTPEGLDMRLVVGPWSAKSLSYIYSNVCNYEKHGGSCRFCNVNAVAKLFPAGIMGHKAKMKNFKTVLQEALQDGKFGRLCLTGGMLPEAEETQAILEVLEVVRDVTGLKRVPVVTDQTAPLDRKNIEKLYEAGLHGANFDLETGDPGTFKALCPGKDKVQGYQGYIQACKWGVEIFGKGRVRSNFVGGIEPASMLLERMEELCSYGVVAAFSPWNARPGSEMEGLRPPEPEWFLELNQRMLDLWVKYDLIKGADALSCMFCEACPTGGRTSVLARMLLEDPDYKLPELQPMRCVSGTCS